ncbi:MAG: TlpA family protein disulfide reductase [Planctomycetia bacterium]|nr:TlpA family protein disulfide reductase [Planctomycetia bacterium]
MTPRYIGFAACLCLTFSVAALAFAVDDKKPAKEGAKGEASQSKVSVKIADWDETLKLVAAHKGKVVVLDAWSTSCQPCMKEFPNLVKLHKKYGGKEVVCMSLSCDFIGIKSKPPEYYRDKVENFLSKQGAEFQNLLSSVPAEDLFEKMELSSIPAVYVYGRDGKLAKRFDNEKAKTEDDNFTYDDVTKLVEELVAKK